MFHALVEQLGGREAISEAKLLEVTRAADLVVAAEDLRARSLRGEAIDLLGLVRLENSRLVPYAHLAASAAAPLTIR